LAEHNPDESGTTNWYTISSFNTLAINTASSLTKGDRVVVVGSLKIRDWDNGERAGTSVEVEATVVAQDLNYGTTEFKRTWETKPHTCNCNKCEKRNV
jgi:single-strand DNA-binding protein